MSSADNLCKQFGPKSGPELFDTMKLLLKEFFEKKIILKKSADDNKIMKNKLPSMQTVKSQNTINGTMPPPSEHLGPLIGHCVITCKFSNFKKGPSTFLFQLTQHHNESREREADH